MPATYIQISRPEFESWLNTIGKWERVSGRQGVYLLLFSDNVALRITTSIGRNEEVVRKGAGAATMNMVERENPKKVLLGMKKALGKIRFNRTIGWKKTWSDGAKRFKSLYTKSKDFYEGLVAVKDLDAYLANWKSIVQATPGWEENDFLSDIMRKLDARTVLSARQENAVRRTKAFLEKNSESKEQAQAQDTPAKLTPRQKDFLAKLQRVRDRAKNLGRDWEYGFLSSILEQIGKNRNLSPKQRATLKKILNYSRYQNASARNVAQRHMETAV